MERGLTQRDAIRLQKFAKLVDGGDVAIAEHVLEIEDKVEEVKESADKALAIAEKTSKEIGPARRPSDNSDDNERCHNQNYHFRHGDSVSWSDSWHGPQNCCGRVTERWN